MKRTVLLLIIGLLSLVLVQQAHAIPALQVYIPGSDYVNETWLATDSSFEVWVIAAQNVNDVYLTIAVPQGEGTVSVNNQEMDAYSNGNPGYGSHGIFDSLYTEYEIGDMIIPATDADDIFNTIDRSDTGKGKIVKLSVAISGYDSVHFDAHGDGMRRGHVVTFAPFSHDAEATPSAVPEPTTMSLLGIGVVGLFGNKIRKNRS